VARAGDSVVRAGDSTFLTRAEVGEEDWKFYLRRVLVKSSSLLSRT
jgi:hypothetical protein